MQAALLFYEKIVADLVEYGFTLNPYDSCVANKMVDGSLLTILWHVDDLKISHANEDVVTDVIEWIRKRYETLPGDCGTMKVVTGKEHDFLGVHFDFRSNGKVIISMIPYILDLIDQFPDDHKYSKRSTPASTSLFKIDSSEEVLSVKHAKVFHTYVAKLLYLTKHARPDIALAVAFLTTRVRNPTFLDWKKLRRCVQYLSCYTHLVLTLKSDNLPINKWWVDASYAVHHDCKGHTGSMLSLGKGAVSCHSTRQKINTRSSTEAELVAVDDMAGQIIWTRNFILAQGFLVHESIVYQDNKSAILLETNGAKSAGKRSKHIAVRYYFIKDRIKSKEVKIEWCSTLDMVSDVFTKPLQGELFTKFRSGVMNLDPVR